VSVTAIDHVLVLSDDIDAARDFYCAALGLVDGERPPLEFAGHWLYADGEPRVHIADRAEYDAHARSLGLPPAPASGARPQPIDHIAFAATDYADAVARLERAGVGAVRNVVPAAGLRQLFFTAPDGVRIEVNVFEAERCAPR
jgi:catechol 2,3-dioxygenase-like lactoylglutathione lyase family enzyme